MLVPAALYKDEIIKRFAEHNYSEDMFNYTGGLGQTNISFQNEDSGVFQYAIVDDKKNLIGYFTYYIDWYVSSASSFGLFAFERNNQILGFDVFKELENLIHKNHLHRIEWRMIGGNPVENHYDKFVKKYNGKKHVLTDATRDQYGNYHDSIIYEILLNS